MSYGELERLSDCCASAFAALGVKQGDRVGLLLPNCPQFFIAQFGAWKLGAIVAPLNPIYTEHELEGPLRDYGIETIVTLTRFYARVKASSREPDCGGSSPPTSRNIFRRCCGCCSRCSGRSATAIAIGLKAGDHDFAHLLLVNADAAGPSTTVTPADPAVLLMSGGTTGTPKGALGTHEAYVCAGLQGKAWKRRR